MIKRLRELHYKQLIGIGAGTILFVLIIVLALRFNFVIGKAGTGANTILTFEPSSNNVEELELKLQKLYDAIVNPNIIEGNYGTGVYTVFISISNGKEKAETIHYTSSNINDSWENTTERIREYVSEFNIEPLWIRADVCKDINFDDLPLENLHDIRVYLAQSKDTNGVISIGLRWINRPDLALTPLYLSTIKELLVKGDNDNYVLDIEVLTNKLREDGLIGDEESVDLYERVVATRCKSWFIGEDDTVVEIDNQGGNFHHRYIDIIDDLYARRIATSGIKYFMRHIDENGKFDYNLLFNNNESDPQSDYNIVRHAGVVWSLAQYYNYYKDMNTGIDMSLLRLMIDKSLDYLFTEENSMTLNIEGVSTMCILSSSLNEGERTLGVGNNGLALVAISEHLGTIGKDDPNYKHYLDMAECLANGIKFMLDSSDDKFNAKFLPLYDNEGNITGISLQGLYGSEVAMESYYAGECGLGLCKLYYIDKDEKWLDLAEKIILQMVDHNTVGTASQWVPYSIFEYLINDVDKQSNLDYYNYALSGIRLNNNEYYYSYSSVIRLEQAMGGFLIYRLADLNNIKLRWFSQDKLLYKIVDSVNRGLSSFIYPEVAMFSDSPQDVLGGFVSRAQGFSIRMDTVQHYILGYMLYDRYYKNLVNQGLLEVGEYGY